MSNKRSSSWRRYRRIGSKRSAQATHTLLITVRQVGRLHEAADHLDHVEHFQDDIEGFQQYGLALLKCAHPTERRLSYRPFTGRSRTQEFLRLCEDILRQLERFDASVEVKAAPCVPFVLLTVVQARIRPYAKPSHAHRHGVAYAVGGVVTLAAGVYGFRHRHGLVATLGNAASGLRYFLREHLEQPLRSVAGELFSAFHPDDATNRITSPKQVRVERDVLAQMLEGFARKKEVDMAGFEVSPVRAFALTSSAAGQQRARLPGHDPAACARG